MARISQRKNKHGVSYQATVRMAGYPSMSRTFATKGEARTWAREVESNIAARRHKDPRLAAISLGEALERYERTITSKKAVTTQPRERRCIITLLRHLGRETLLPDITPAVVASYRDRRLQQVTAYAVRLELALLSHLYTKARQEWEIPIDNPVAQIERPPVPQGRARFLNQEEIERLLEQCKRSRNPRLYPYVLVLLHSAMRPGEAAALRRWQVDEERQVIILEDTKNRDRRRVPLTAAALEALRPLLAGKGPDDPILMNQEQAETYGAVTPPRAFRESFNGARRRAGLPWLHIHDLRHTAASWLLMRGVDIRTLAAILGHRTLQMVLRYTHLLDDHKRQAVELIGDLGLPRQQSKRTGSQEAGDCG